MKHYIVISPEMSEVIPILDDGTGPTEYFCCAVVVEAENKRDAKSYALKTKEFKAWLEEARWNKSNPFSGLKVEEYDLQSN